LIKMQRLLSSSITVTASFKKAVVAAPFRNRTPLYNLLSFSTSEKPELSIDEKYIDLEKFKLDNDVLKALSLDTANQRTLVQAKVRHTLKRFQVHQSDTGSPSVQIAVATEKIANLARHFVAHRKDNQSNRGFQSLLSRRRKMMQYLRNTDPKEFEKVVRVLGLQKEASHLPGQL